MRAGSNGRTVGALLLPAALLLPSCQKDTDPGPGGVTIGEARALDDAAEMLEKRPIPPPVDAATPGDLATVQTPRAHEAKSVTNPSAKPAAKPAAKQKP
jgi:hypothetical protein